VRVRRLLFWRYLLIWRKPIIQDTWQCGLHDHRPDRAHCGSSREFWDRV